MQLWLLGKRSGIFQVESFTNIDQENKIGDHQQSPSDSGTEISDDENIKYSSSCFFWLYFVAEHLKSVFLSCVLFEGQRKNTNHFKNFWKKCDNISGKMTLNFCECL